MKTKNKTLRRYTNTLYLWRNLELSLMRWNGLHQWNLTWSGCSRKLPCGAENRMFPSLVAADAYLQQHGFKVEL